MSTILSVLLLTQVMAENPSGNIRVKQGSVNYVSHLDLGRVPQEKSEVDKILADPDDPKLYIERG